jgi:alcohol dehydrogenase (cytochrome c)
MICRTGRRCWRPAVGSCSPAENSEFIALDADDGKTLWQFQTGSGINAMPVTYTHQGRQYVTVLSGLGGLYWNMAKELLKDVAPGGSVWTFALLPN